MIRVSADKGEVALAIEGDGEQICAEATCLIRAIYNALWRESPFEAVLFRLTTEKGLPFSEVAEGETINLTGMSVDEMEQAANELRERMKNE